MKKTLPLALICALLCALLYAPTAFGSKGKSDSEKFRDAVTVKRMLAHEAALNAIGVRFDGNRLAGTKGHDASSLYVGAQAALSGLKVSQQEFDYDLFALGDWKAPILSVVTPGQRRTFIPGIAGSIPGGDFGSMVNSASGDLTAPLWAADLTIPSPAPNTSDSGCEAEDFAGMPVGAIVLLQRGVCGELTKFLNAQTAGAGAIVYINEGNVGVPGREEPRWFDMTGAGVTIPITAAQVATVAELAGGVPQGLVGKTARFRIEWRTGLTPTQNVIAETRGGDPNKVIVVGAHLDSVGTGPGINDNGSGSAALVEFAKQINKFKLRNKVRFIWFSAEESGLLGSQAYVDSLPESERNKIAAMLNFDMIASPNFARFVYDGDLSDSEPPPGGAPAGSAEIEQMFLDYFASKGLATEPTAFDGRSDYGPFIAAGIPAGGLFTGAEAIKTPEQVALFGGTAGEKFDPCYHLGCDNIRNLSSRGYDQMSDAAAHVLLTLAQAQTLPARDPAPLATGRSQAKPTNLHNLPQPAALDGK